LETFVEAAGSCPTLTPPRLAAELMAASRFGVQTPPDTGGEGIAVFTGLM
jgi:hypothetical protein